MFLLIPDTDISIITATELFTFHNVSINSNEADRTSERIKNLHSTMFLLIRGSG